MRYFALLFLLLTIACAGCAAKTPSGFPKIIPCEVTVTDQGVPLDGASVNLVPSEPQPGLIVGAISDTSGTAVVKTMKGDYSQAGAPEGTYKVLITKSTEVGMTQLSTEESFAQTPQQRAAREKEFQQKLKAARVVPEILSGRHSPLEILVAPGGAKMTVDIAEYREGKK